MKKLLLCLLLSIILVGTALAVNSIDSAYQRASKEAGETTTAVVESIHVLGVHNHKSVEILDSFCYYGTVNIRYLSMIINFASYLKKVGGGL